MGASFTFSSSASSREYPVASASFPTGQDIVLPRLDMYFSYWILGWFLLYHFKYIPYNPKLFIIFAVFVNFTGLVVEYMMKQKMLYMILEVIIIAIIKGIPLYLLRNSHTKKSDIVFGTELYLIYLTYMYVLRGDIGRIFSTIGDGLDNIRHQRPTTPIISWMMRQV